MKKLIIFIGKDINNELGGSIVFAKNLDKYLRKEFLVYYHFLPKRFYETSILPKRLMYFVYCLFSIPNLVNKYDYFLSHSPEASFILSFFSKNFIHIYHGNFNPVKMSKYFYGKYFVWFYDLIDKRIQKKAKISFTVGENKKGCKKLFSPIDIEDYKYHSNINRKNFYFIGRFEKVKNIFRLVDIYDLLDKNTKKYNKLILIGDGTLKQELIEYVQKKNLNKYVIFTGQLSNSDTLKHLEKAKILLLASYSEGFPMVIAEALSRGVPVISTAVGNIPNVIKNGYNGFCLKQSDNNQEFVNKINKILTNYDFFSNNAFNSSKIFDAKYIANILIKSFYNNE